MMNDEWQGLMDSVSQALQPNESKAAAIRRLAIAGALALLALLSGCGRRESTDDGSLSTYRADFGSDKELSFWRCYDQGKWEIRDGWLVADARNTSPSRTILWLSFPLPDSVTIEFEGECLDKPGDLYCFLYGDGHQYSGYEIAVGASDNKRIGVYKSNLDGNEDVHKRLGRDAIALTRDRGYAIKVKKYKSSIRLYVNDELIISASDKTPTPDHEHRYFGLSTVGNLVRFDNLKIEVKR